MPKALEKGKQLLREARQAHRKSQFAAAARLYQQAAHHLWDQKRREAWLQAAHCLRLVGRFRSAVVYYAKAAAGATQSSFLLDATVGKAMALRALGELDKASQLFQAALSEYGRMGDREGQAYTLWCLGGTYRFQGQFHRAWEVLQQSLKLYRTLEQPEAEAYVCCALGGLSRMRGDYSSSHSFYSQAQKLLKGLDDTFGQAYSACGLANAHRMVGQWEKALGYFSRAQELYQTIGDRVSYAYTLWGEGTLWKVLGEWEKARAFFRKALAFFRQTQDQRGISYAYAALGELWALRGRPRQARWYLQKAEARAVARGFRFEQLHAQLLLQLLAHQDPGPLPAAYQALGSHWLPQNVRFPINFP